MKFYSQSFLYDDSWPIVSLAFFLRYPNPYAAHVLSCDVISRTTTPSGSLLTTRLILKRGALPRWAQSLISRSETWVLEESEVDPVGRLVRCRTRNLDHVKVMQVEESVVLRPADDGKTMQTTQVSISSRFGWGMTKKIESHGLSRFQANMQRSREGVSLILNLLRQSKPQPMALGLSADADAPPHSFAGISLPVFSRRPADRDAEPASASASASAPTPVAPKTRWSTLRSWVPGRAGD